MSRQDQLLTGIQSFPAHPERWLDLNDKISVDRLPNVKPLPPLSRFESVKRFEKRHGIGTRKEFALEWSQHNEFNTMQIYYAWAILMLNDERNSRDWLFLVQPGRNDKMLPKEGERCYIKIPRGGMSWTQEEGAPKLFSSSTEMVQFEAIRIGNPCLGWGIREGYWQRCMAFEVNILKSEPHPFKVIIDSKTAEKGLSEIPRPKTHELYVAFELRLSTSTRDAELMALDEFVRVLSADKSSATRHRRTAFEFLLAFEATTYSSLYRTFPHLADPISAPHKVTQGLRSMFEKLNSQQIDAFKHGLSRIPNNVCFVAGGPGAGYVTPEPPFRRNYSINPRPERRTGICASWLLCKASTSIS